MFENTRGMCIPGVLRATRSRNARILSRSIFSSSPSFRLSGSIARFYAARAVGALRCMGDSIRSMPETHIPKLDRHVNNPDAAVKGTRAKSILHIGLEVILISVGVFLGLAGEQWREHRRHQELAESSLRDFRSEIVTNRKAVQDVKDYHAALLKSLKSYLGKDHKARNTADVQ